MNDTVQSDAREEQRLFLESVDKYLGSQKTAKPLAPGEPARHNPAQWAEMAAMGWLGLGLPEAAGGFLGTAEVNLLFEKWGSTLLTAPLLDNLVLCGPLLAHYGSSAQQAVAADMVQGNRLLALALFEPQNRYDWHLPLSSIAVAGPPDAPAGWTLTGRKARVASAADATHLLVLVRDDAAPSRAGEGLSLLLLPQNTPGIGQRNYRSYDDCAYSDIQFGAVAIAPGDFVGSRGQGRAMLARAMDSAYIALAAQAAGAMQSACQLTIDYAKTRKQFGRVLSSNQAYQHALVDLYVAVEEAKALVREANHHLAQAQRSNKPADIQTASRWASAAKAFTASEGRMVGEQSVQLHGAIGMTQDYAVGGYYKRLAALANHYGDAEWHGLRIRDLDTEHPDGNTA